MDIGRTGNVEKVKNEIGKFLSFLRILLKFFGFLNHMLITLKLPNFSPFHIVFQNGLIRNEVNKLHSENVLILQVRDFL